MVMIEARLTRVHSIKTTDIVSGKGTPPKEWLGVCFLYPGLWENIRRTVTVVESCHRPECICIPIFMQS